MEEDKGNIFGVPMSSDTVNTARGQILDAMSSGTLFPTQKVEYRMNLNDPIASIPGLSGCAPFFAIILFIGIVLILGNNKPEEFDNVTIIQEHYQAIDFYKTIVARSYNKEGNVTKSYTIFNKIPSNAVYDLQRYNECMAAYWFDRGFRATRDKDTFIATYYKGNGYYDKEYNPYYEDLETKMRKNDPLADYNATMVNRGAY